MGWIIPSLIFYHRSLPGLQGCPISRENVHEDTNISGKGIFWQCKSCQNFLSSKMHQTLFHSLIKRLKDKTLFPSLPSFQTKKWMTFIRIILFETQHTIYWLLPLFSSSKGSLRKNVHQEENQIAKVRDATLIYGLLQLFGSVFPFKSQIL